MTAAATTCLSCALCDCAAGCSACRMWVPFETGPHRLSQAGADAAAARDCRCDQPRHCAGHEWCVCDRPLDPETIAALLRELPGVTGVRIRKHASLPTVRPARYLQIGDSPPEIVVGIEDPGSPPVKIVASYDKKGPSPLSYDGVAESLAALSDNHQVCPNMDLKQFPGSKDPRPRRRTHPIHVVDAYVRAALDNKSRVPADLAGAKAALRDPNAAARDYLRAAVLADADGTVPAGLAFPAAAGREAPAGALRAPYPAILPVEPIAVSTFHCDDCYPDKLPALLAPALAAATEDGAEFASAAEHQLDKVWIAESVLLAEGALVDIGSEHQLAAWPLAFLTAVLQMLAWNGGAPLSPSAAQLACEMLLDPYEAKGSEIGRAVAPLQESLVDAANALGASIRAHDHRHGDHSRCRDAKDVSAAAWESFINACTDFNERMPAVHDRVQRALRAALDRAEGEEAEPPAEPPVQPPAPAPQPGPAVSAQDTSPAPAQETAAEDDQDEAVDATGNSTDDSDDSDDLDTAEAERLLRGRLVELAFLRRRPRDAKSATADLADVPAAEKALADLKAEKAAEAARLRERQGQDRLRQQVLEARDALVEALTG